MSDHDFGCWVINFAKMQVNYGNFQKLYDEDGFRVEAHKSLVKAMGWKPVDCYGGSMRSREIRYNSDTLNKELDEETKAKHEAYCQRIDLQAMLLAKGYGKWDLPHEDTLQKGSRVRFKGLTTIALNGVTGKCEEWLSENGRWRVLVDGGSGDKKDIKPENLELVKESAGICPKGHKLVRYVNPTPNGCNSCDKCGRNPIQPPECVYRCGECDWDLCIECNSKPKAFRPPRAGAQPPAAQTPDKVVAQSSYEQAQAEYEAKMAKLKYSIDMAEYEAKMAVYSKDMAKYNQQMAEYQKACAIQQGGHGRGYPQQAVPQFRLGAAVEYCSASHGQWIPTRVCAYHASTGLYDLECRPSVEPQMIRLAKVQVRT